MVRRISNRPTKHKTQWTQRGHSLPSQPTSQRAHQERVSCTLFIVILYYLLVVHCQWISMAWPRRHETKPPCLMDRGRWCRSIDWSIIVYGALLLARRYALWGAMDDGKNLLVFLCGSWTTREEHHANYNAIIAFWMDAANNMQLLCMTARTTRNEGMNEARHHGRSN